MPAVQHKLYRIEPSRERRGRHVYADFRGDFIDKCLHRTYRICKVVQQFNTSRPFPALENIDLSRKRHAFFVKRTVGGFGLFGRRFYSKATVLVFFTARRDNKVIFTGRERFRRGVQIGKGKLVRFVSSLFRIALGKSFAIKADRIIAAAFGAIDKRDIQSRDTRTLLDNLFQGFNITGNINRNNLVRVACKCFHFFVRTGSLVGIDLELISLFIIRARIQAFFLKAESLGAASCRAHLRCRRSCRQIDFAAVGVLDIGCDFPVVVIVLHLARCYAQRIRAAALDLSQFNGTSVDDLEVRAHDMLRVKAIFVRKRIHVNRQVAIRHGRIERREHAILVRKRDSYAMPIGIVQAHQNL